MARRKSRHERREVREPDDAMDRKRKQSLRSDHIGPWIEFLPVTVESQDLVGLAVTAWGLKGVC
jgi:hypothetical protein